MPGSILSPNLPGELYLRAITTGARHRFNNRYRMAIRQKWRCINYL